MPILYDPSPYAYFCEGDSLVEPDHQKSTDANYMIRAAANGQPISGSGQEGIYWPDGGHDDLQQDIISVKAAKERIEAELGETFASNEFTEAEQRHIPPHIKKRFKIRTKSEAPLVPQAEPKGVSPHPSVLPSPSQGAPVLPKS